MSAAFCCLNKKLYRNDSYDEMKIMTIIIFLPATGWACNTLKLWVTKFVFQGDIVGDEHVF